MFSKVPIFYFKPIPQVVPTRQQSAEDMVEELAHILVDLHWFDLSVELPDKKSTATIKDASLYHFKLANRDAVFQPELE